MIDRKITSTVCIAASLLFSCESRIPKGYEEIAEGFYYKMHSFDESKRQPMKGDYLTVSAELRTEKDALIFSTAGQSIDGTIEYRADIKDTIPSLLSCIDDGLMMMHEGDSISFLMNTDTAFRKIESWILKLSKQKMLKFNVKLYKIRNEAEHEEERERQNKLLEDADIREKMDREKYVKGKNISAKPFENGFYFVEEKPGRGDTVRAGRTVTVHYIASFLNGRVFHSTYDSQPLEFTFGEQGQVIKGMEIGLGRMCEGGKAKFIIPSHLAFGEQGSSTGQIPPFTTLIYEVEVVKVKSHI